MRFTKHEKFTKFSFAWKHTISDKKANNFLYGVVIQKKNGGKASKITVYREKKNFSFHDKLYFKA